MVGHLGGHVAGEGGVEAAGLLVHLHQVLGCVHGVGGDELGVLGGQVVGVGELEDVAAGGLGDDERVNFMGG